MVLLLEQKTQIAQALNVLHRNRLKRSQSILGAPLLVLYVRQDDYLGTLPTLPTDWQPTLGLVYLAAWRPKLV